MVNSKNNKLIFSKLKNSLGRNDGLRPVEQFINNVDPMFVLESPYQDNHKYVPNDNPLMIKNPKKTFGYSLTNFKRRIN